MFAHTEFHDKKKGINIALKKTFASVSNESSPTVVTPLFVTNEELYAK